MLKIRSIMPTEKYFALNKRINHTKARSILFVSGKIYFSAWTGKGVIVESKQGDYKQFTSNFLNKLKLTSCEVGTFNNIKLPGDKILIPRKVSKLAHLSPRTEFVLVNLHSRNDILNHLWWAMVTMVNHGYHGYNKQFPKCCV